MHKMMKYARRAMICALVAMLLCGGALAASYGAKVLMPSMDVYGAANGEPVRLGALKQGTSIRVTAVSGDWARIRYKDRTLYAKLEDIMFNKRIKAVAKRDAKIKFVTKSSYRQNIYYSATLSAGATVYVAGINDDLFLVTNASGSAIGYVDASALTRA